MKIFRYLLILLCCPKKAAEAVNEATDREDMERRMFGGERL